jgi:hypothetical protein
MLTVSPKNFIEGGRDGIKFLKKVACENDFLVFQDILFFMSEEEMALV